MFLVSHHFICNSLITYSPVYPKADQFIGKTDAEAETPILWPPDAYLFSTSISSLMRYLCSDHFPLKKKSDCLFSYCWTSVFFVHVGYESFCQICVFIYFYYLFIYFCSGFCHTLTWISHGFTCIPHPDQDGGYRYVFL